MKFKIWLSKNFLNKEIKMEDGLSLERQYLKKGFAIYLKLLKQLAEGQFSNTKL